MGTHHTTTPTSSDPYIQRMAEIKALADDIGERAARAILAAWTDERCTATFVDRLIEACEEAAETTSETTYKVEVWHEAGAAEVGIYRTISARMAMIQAYWDGQPPARGREHRETETDGIVAELSAEHGWEDELGCRRFDADAIEDGSQFHGLAGVDCCQLDLADGHVAVAFAVDVHGEPLRSAA